MEKMDHSKVVEMRAELGIVHGEENKDEVAKALTAREKKKIYMRDYCKKNRARLTAYNKAYRRERKRLSESQERNYPIFIHLNKLGVDRLVPIKDDSISSIIGALAECNIVSGKDVKCSIIRVLREVDVDECIREYEELKTEERTSMIERIKTMENQINELKMRLIVDRLDPKHTKTALLIDNTTSDAHGDEKKPISKWQKVV